MSAVRLFVFALAVLLMVCFVVPVPTAGAGSGLPSKLTFKAQKELERRATAAEGKEQKSVGARVWEPFALLAAAVVGSIHLLYSRCHWLLLFVVVMQHSTAVYGTRCSCEQTLQ